MSVRPFDDRGDILPVLRIGQLVIGKDAVVREVELKLGLLTGQWWENAAVGCAIVDMIREARLTEQDLQTISVYLSSYVQKIPGVQSVENVAAGFVGRQIRFSCDIRVDGGYGSVSYDWEM